jgi:hypothetical protein
MNLEIQIQKRIDELIASSDPADLRRVAESLNALPIWADMSGWLALRPDGSFVFLNGETEEVTEEVATQFKLVGLVNSSEKYPELKTLIPVRPDHADDCRDCKGTGRFIFESKVYNPVFCGKFSGLGWSV